MSKLKWQKILIIFVAAIGLFLLMKSQRISHIQHDRFNSNLRLLKEVDAALNQKVIKSRYGLLSYYDPLNNDLAQINKLQKELNNIPSFIEQQGERQLKKLLQDQAAVLLQKEELIERFKSENAILKNSLYYFPTLTSQLVEKTARQDRKITATLEVLLQDTLLYNLTNSEDLAPKIQKHLAQLSIESQAAASIQIEDINRAIVHSKIILSNKPKVDTLIKKIVSLPTWERSEEIYTTYNRQYQEKVKSTNVYRLFLYLFSIILVGSIAAYIIAKLKKSAKIVSKALEATQQAEEKYRSIFENSTDGIFQTTLDGRFISANSTLARIYGYESVEKLINNVNDINKQIYVNPQRRDEFIAAINYKDAISHFESQVYRQDGSIIWISENARTVKDRNGKILYYEGTVDDITARKQAETALSASQAKLTQQQTALIELAKCQPLYNGNLTAAFKAITETAAHTLGIERVGIGLYNQDFSKIDFVDLYVTRTNEHIEGIELAAIDYPNYFQALKTNESVIVANDAHNDPRTQEFVDTFPTQTKIKSMLDAPIRLGGRTVGMLCMRHTGTPIKWSLEDQNFASYLAYMASLAMEASDRVQAQEALRLEQEKVEMLLLNILPEPIAQRLKQDSGSIAESFSEVTVLFADIVGFTELSANINPIELVELLNKIFSAFDQLAEQHGLEKIKTIGDAYMVVGGLPMPHPDHAEAIAHMALDMQQEIKKFVTNNRKIDIRVGINTGPVVAGVIGIKKFIYDLWGDTVNIASRMESHGIPGAIQVTATTYEYLQAKFMLEKRGVIHVKGRGEMTTYLLNGRIDNT